MPLLSPNWSKQVGRFSKHARAKRRFVLVTDIQLAGYLSGWEVAEGFRAATPDIPVVYMSGKAVDKSRMVPGSVFLSKPFAPQDVLAAARETMQMSQRTA